MINVYLAVSFKGIPWFLSPDYQPETALLVTDTTGCGISFVFTSRNGFPTLFSPTLPLLFLRLHEVILHHLPLIFSLVAAAFRLIFLVFSFRTIPPVMYASFPPLFMLLQVIRAFDTRLTRLVCLFYGFISKYLTTCYRYARNRE